MKREKVNNFESPTRTAAASRWREITQVLMTGGQRLWFQERKSKEEIRECPWDREGTSSAPDWEASASQPDTFAKADTSKAGVQGPRPGSAACQSKPGVSFVLVTTTEWGPVMCMAVELSTPKELMASIKQWTLYVMTILSSTHHFQALWLVQWVGKTQLVISLMESNFSVMRTAWRSSTSVLTVTSARWLKEKPWAIYCHCKNASLASHHTWCCKCVMVLILHPSYDLHSNLTLTHCIFCMWCMPLHIKSLMVIRAYLDLFALLWSPLTWLTNTFCKC